MNKWMIAAGVGALLVVGQTAVSATLNPWNAKAPASVEAAAPATAVASAAPRAAMAETRIDDRLLQSQERTTTRPTAEQQAAARARGQQYEMRHEVTESTTTTEEYQCASGSMSSANMAFLAGASCGMESNLEIERSISPYWVLAPLTVAAVVAFSDNGDSD